MEHRLTFLGWVCMRKSNFRPFSGWGYAVMRLIRIASRSGGTNDSKYVKRISFVRSIRYWDRTGNRISSRLRDVLPSAVSQPSIRR